MQKYFYLILNILTISFPLLRSFEPKIRFAEKWSALFPAIMISATAFIIWDHYFTIMGVWSFNNRYITGLFVGALPIEEWLFFITVPFSCVFIHEVLNKFVKKDLFAKIAPFITILIIGAFMLIGLLHLDKWYTSINFIVGALVLFTHYMIYGTAILGRFYLTYLVHLVPFIIINGILTGSYIEEPIVLYNNAETLAIRIGTIPVEDFVYSMSLLLMNITLYTGFAKMKKAPLIKKEYA